MREAQLTLEFHAWLAAASPKYTIAKIRRWQSAASAIARQKNPARALDHWWSFSKKLTPLEDEVSEAVFEYDEWINMQVKDMRMRDAR